MESPFKCKILICWYKFWMGTLCHWCLREVSVSIHSAYSETMHLSSWNSGQLLTFLIFVSCLKRKKIWFKQWQQAARFRWALWHAEGEQVQVNVNKVNAQDADIDTTTLTAKWPLFKLIMFEKPFLYCTKVDSDISRAHPENVQELIKKRESYTLQKLWDNFKYETTVKEIYPNCIYPIHLLLIFPISIVCVECLFSWMRLLKTRLCTVTNWSKQPWIPCCILPPNHNSMA